MSNIFIQFFVAISAMTAPTAVFTPSTNSNPKSPSSTHEVIAGSRPGNEIRLPSTQITPSSQASPAPRMRAVMAGERSSAVTAVIPRAAKQAPQHIAVTPASTSGNVVLAGERTSTSRPQVVARALPASIVIDARSAVCHCALTPATISKKGLAIQLTDGSIWKIRQRDRHKVKKWKNNDLIIIESGKFFFWNGYSLTNLTAGESVDAELYLPEDRSGSTTHWVVEVNPQHGFVRLENGSVWQMSVTELGAWRQQDDVIIALSKSWLTGNYNYVLINPRVKHRFTATLHF